MDYALRWKESLKPAEANYPKDEVVDFARKKKITEADLIHLTLVAKRKSKKRRYDLFCDGITFPIRDLDGSVVGFGKRALPRASRGYACSSCS